MNSLSIPKWRGVKWNPFFLEIVVVLIWFAGVIRQRRECEAPSRDVGEDFNYVPSEGRGGQVLCPYGLTPTADK